MKKDYYLILHVKPEASAEEVRSAYRQCAREVHPDASVDVQEAYSVLGDPSRRAAYDNQSGDIPVRRSAEWRTRLAEPLRAFEPASGPDDVSLLESFDRF